MRALIAEDDPTSRMIFERLLGKWGYQVVLARDGEEAWAVMEGEDAPPLLLLDWMMPGLDGVSLCRRLRKSERGKRVYVILVSAREGKDDLVEAMEAGADDYLVKPVVPEELRVRLRAGQRILDLQSELVTSREAFRERSRRDSLTGLLNRGAIFGVLARHLEIGALQGSPVSVIMADLDEFKRVNDSFGHRAGDAVLVEFARILVETVRSSDAVGRWGGEEFLILLPGAPLTAAATLAERVRSRLEESAIPAGGYDIHVTVSLGVVSSDDVPAPGVDAVVDAADQALYRAKALGRNRVVATGSGQRRSESPHAFPSAGASAADIRRPPGATLDRPGGPADPDRGGDSP